MDNVQKWRHYADGTLEEWDNVQIWRDAIPNFASEWDCLIAECLSTYKYNYMVTTLTHAAVALKSGTCDEHVQPMYENACTEIIRTWYDLPTR